MKVKDQVENILKFSRSARNSDKELLVTYMQKFGMGLNEHQILVFKRMPSTETIRRIRQALQHEGKYPADQKIKTARNFSGLTMQQRNPSSDKIEKTLKAVSWLED